MVFFLPFQQSLFYPPFAKKYASVNWQTTEGENRKTSTLFHITIKQ